MIPQKSVRAAIYLRHSPKPEAKRNNDSIENQRAACLRYAQFAGLNIVTELVQEFQSARLVPFAKRGGNQVIELARSAGVRHLVCQRVDRIFRDVADGLQSMELLRRNKISLHFADEGGSALNCDTATGQMLFTVRLAFAAFEPALTAERTRAAMTQMLAEMICLSPSAPYGFAVDGKRIKGGGSRPNRDRWKLKFNMDEVRNLQLMHKWQFIDGLSYQEITDLMNQRWIRDKTYGGRDGVRWNRSRVHAILNDARARPTWEAVLTLDAGCPEEYDRLATLGHQGVILIPPETDLQNLTVEIERPQSEAEDLPADIEGVDDDEGEFEGDVSELDGL